MCLLPPARYPLLLLFSCDTHRLSANFAFLNWFLLPPPSLLLPLSLSHSLALYLSLDAHFCLSARINFNGPHTPPPLNPFPLHIYTLSSFLSTPFPFPFPFFFYCPWSSAIHPFLGSFARALAFVMSAGECECEGRRRRRVCLHITHTPRCVALAPAAAAGATRRRCMPRTSLVNNSC